jgi:hypothetical protein
MLRREETSGDLPRSQNLGRQYIDGRLGIDTLEERARRFDSLDRL